MFSLAILNAIGGNYHDHVVYMGRGTGGSFFKGGQVVSCLSWALSSIFFVSLIILLNLYLSGASSDSCITMANFYDAGCKHRI